MESTLTISTQEAVCLWDDSVGDSGKAPTDQELTDFANAVHTQAIQPYLDRAEVWIKRAEELDEKALWMISTGQATIGRTLHLRASAYRHLGRQIKGEA